MKTKLVTGISLVTMFLFFSTSEAKEVKKPTHVNSGFGDLNVPFPQQPDQNRKKWGTDTFPYLDPPKSNSVEDFTAWGKLWMQNVRNEAIINRAAIHPKYPGAQTCVQFAGAFKITPISAVDAEVICYAGKGNRKISHELKYRFALKQEPLDCAEEAKIREYFSKVPQRNLQTLDAFVAHMKENCRLTAFPVKPNPKDKDYVIKGSEIGESQLKEILAKPENKPLADWLEGENPSEESEPCNPLNPDCNSSKIKGLDRVENAK